MLTPAKLHADRADSRPIDGGIVRNPRFTHSFRLSAIAILAALFSSVLASSIGASAQDLDSSQSSPSAELPSELAGNGLAIESALDRVGLGDEWRAETALGERTRRLLVEYPSTRTRSAVLKFATVVAELENTKTLRDSMGDEVLRSSAFVRLTRWNEDRLASLVSDGQERLDAIRRSIQSVAIDMYARRGGRSDEVAALAHPDLLLTRRSDELTATVLRRLIVKRDELDLQLSSARISLPAARRVRAAAELNQKDLIAVATELPDRISGLETDTAEMLPAAAEAFLSAEVPDEPGLSLRALDAYFNAEAWMNESQPECGITWQTIGAIGLVESRHGTHLGNRLLPDGRTQFQIVGAMLDGGVEGDATDAVATVTDTDGGVYDGDPTHDRAVGPMQFIPETWRQWSVDADGDGRRDPNDMDDAAVATARYLCANGSVRSRPAWNAAILTYNQSSSYVESIRAAYHRLDDTVAAATVESDEAAVDAGLNS